MGNAPVLEGDSGAWEPLAPKGGARADAQAAADAAAATLPLRTLEEDERAHRRRWRGVMRAGVAASRQADEERFQHRVRKGIPSEHRWQVWKAALHSDGRTAGRYAELVTHDTPWLRLIEVDGPRTFPGVASFDEERRGKMQRVLRAYACFNPEVGYCQGMNFIAGTLLQVADGAEEETFEAFVALMEDYHLNGFYKERFPLLERYIRAFVQLLDETCPDVASHLTRVGVQPGDYLHRWFLTLFINSLPTPAALIIWDGIICRGLDVILPVTVALLQVLRCVLLAMSFEDIHGFLRAIGSSKEPEQEALTTGRLLMRKSSQLHVSAEIKSLLQPPA